ncbi:hypothetical protein Tco_0652262 [Tanacetum coccineum]|uniref:Uncharacterized protein n=1 Tax=Tanacetum coccineum TaxID=301880 RepID=A0ABQ4WX29_9ASTR
MEQMATLRELVDQAIQKKEEEKRIAEEQAARDRSWKIPICYDDDEDNTIAITQITRFIPYEEPNNSLSMGDEHLDTIPETESDEFIKSSVEDLVPIPSESEGIPDKMCDVPLCENTTPLEALKEHSETIIDYNDDSTFRVMTIVYENIGSRLHHFPILSPYPGDMTSIDLGFLKNASTTNVNVPLDDDQSTLPTLMFAGSFFAFLTYHRFPPYLSLHQGNEDTFLIPAFSNYHSF